MENQRKKSKKIIMFMSFVGSFSGRHTPELRAECRAPGLVKVSHALPCRGEAPMRLKIEPHPKQVIGRLLQELVHNSMKFNISI